MKLRSYMIIKIVIALLLVVLLFVLLAKVEELEDSVPEQTTVIQKVPTSVNFVIYVEPGALELDNDDACADTLEQIQEEEKLGDIELVAQMVQAEAGNQDLKGKRLVADVIYNRQSLDWADSIEGVIYQQLDGVHQFSSIDDGNFNKAGWNISEESFIAARLEYNPQYRLDSDILYFSADRYNNSGTPAYKYQNHYFSYE